VPPKPAAPSSPLGSIPTAPTEEEWRALRLDERERLLAQILDVLSDPRAAMSEGRPHKNAKTRALDMLGLHFGALGRVVYLAEEMAVLYPGREVFTPDVLAVLDVPQPEDDERMAWVVADEGRGLDLVLEVLHHGDRNKDLVDNVERYADLGIPEYFVYDRAQQRIRGHRLPAPGAKRYVPVLAQGGRYHSAVLGLDLAVEEGTLRFFHGMSELFGSGDLIRRLTGMVQDSEAKADHAVSEADQAKAGLRAGILAALDTRGLSASEALRGRIASCDDPATLQHWLLRALSASRAEDAIDAGPSS
jgi:Uma2 family endonuclease